MSELATPPRRGMIAWANLDPTQGREQAGRRPVLVVSSDGYNQAVPNVIIVLPITTRDRELPHHVPLEGLATGLGKPSFAMTEQPRTIDRQRLQSVIGHAKPVAMAAIDCWLRDFLDLPG